MENRTQYDSGVRWGYDQLLGLTTPVGLGITPAQAAGAAAPLLELLNKFPALDEHGKLNYRQGSSAMNHMPQLVYAADHPLAGQLIWADRTAGDDWVRYGGMPAPFIDMDSINPFILERFVGAMTEAAVKIASAT